MILTYTKITNQYYLEGSDEWEEDGEDFEYEIDLEQELEALTQIAYNLYFSKLGRTLTKEQLKQLKASITAMISDFSDEELDDWKEFFEDDIKEYFRDDAFESIN